MQTDRGDGLYGCKSLLIYKPWIYAVQISYSLSFLSLAFIVVDPNDRSVPVDQTGKRETPNREYVVMIAVSCK